ncbi:DUF4139 domain-containing protein [Novosphingobium ginsenosidimutans]|uniref:DUF4139 domain-containing protein n=1 Tax=Novosphingobium ginsenosidimutans TaxID=1176536 RepID=A0A5B8S2K9_9SPHN|nr:hypothetical protein [Novosphingobium ginsenosidimutans]QEA14957.1 hypothetical protein FRF71_01740 [Novosphingobium ginsenosidimutans]
MRRFAALLLLIAAPLAAQERAPVVISAVPEKVAVTLYRDPDRGEDPIDADDPSSLALIVETRTVTLPAGVATVRFEGVAGGIVPQTAIMFNAAPRERNRDAALLSHGGLVDAFTGQRVTLRHTDPATGKTVEESATIRSAADRLVVTTPRGIEALYCSGLNQTVLYPNVPATLSAKPVLSMTTRDQPGGTVTITLAYLATGFDWDANYVVTIAPDGQSVGLLGWLTMASGDETTFPEATLAAVAGRIQRSDATSDDTGEDARWAASSLNRSWGCWPAGTTSSGLRSPPPPPPPAPPPMMMAMADSAEIIVTGMRREASLMSAPVAVTAVMEGLGDLKLYRVPIPVTVAAQSQKQVAFLAKDEIKGVLAYRSKVEWNEPSDPQILFRFKNSEKEGLGKPLPAGRLVFYQDGENGTMVMGESTLPDKAVDEEVELEIGNSEEVTLEHEEEASDLKGKWADHLVTVKNANPFPIRFELEFPTGSDMRFSRLSGRTERKPGKQVLVLAVPANSEQQVRYRSTEVRQPGD